MKLRSSPDFDKELSKIKRSDPKLGQKVITKLKILETDPRHPSLRMHQLSGKRKNEWSISVDKSIRILFLLLDNDEAYLSHVGTHDQVYRVQRT